MKSIASRQRLTADANHTIHVTLPPDMGDKMAQLMDETGFARNVLASAEEDCWNAL